MVLEIAAEQAENAPGLAVEAAPEAEDFVLARRRLREAERGLDGLRAAGKELNAREARGREGCSRSRGSPRPAQRHGLRVAGGVVADADGGVSAALVRRQHAPSARGRSLHICPRLPDPRADPDRLKARGNAAYASS